MNGQPEIIIKNLGIISSCWHQRQPWRSSDGLEPTTQHLRRLSLVLHLHILALVDIQTGTTHCKALRRTHGNCAEYCTSSYQARTSSFPKLDLAYPWMSEWSWFTRRLTKLSTDAEDMIGNLRRSRKRGLCIVLRAFLFHECSRSTFTWVLNMNGLHCIIVIL